MRKELKVRPDAGTDEISEKNGELQVKVKAPARDNKANLAVIRLISKHFGREVRIISGHKRKRKVVEISD
jgi:uncharacterized protein (TIGR00251 family)